MNRLIWIFGALLLISAIAILRPVPIVNEDKALVQKGEVLRISEGGVNDVMIILKDVPRTFYINRGLEQGLELESLRSKLTGKEVTLKYPKYWTPLDWNNRIKHVSKLEFEGEVLFNELK